MRPPQDPEIVRKGMAEPWFIEFDDVEPAAREILEKYSGIAPEDVVPHVRRIRDKAFSIFIYPCIGMLKFLDIELILTGCYDEIKSRLTAGEKYLEVGCCFGQELRQLAIDGVPSENLYATDLDLDFATLGYELFRDEGRLKATFIAADILTPGPELDAVRGRISLLNAGYFFHLFTWEQQVAIGTRLVGLLAPERKALITGAHVGAVEYEEALWLGKLLSMHSPASWARLWAEIGAATGTEWAVSTSKDPAPATIYGLAERCYVMRFTVRQV